MDESPNDLDQLFKEAAQNAAGLAHVLDPTTAIERGTRRRRFARRRRGALSGLVVLVAVVVFLVPLPQLHLFGSSGSHGGKDQHQSATSSLASTASTPTTSSVTGTGPLGGVIPADFQPGSFTAVSLDEWWMLGSARCLTGSGTCGAIVRTTDGGSKFAGIPSPPVSSSEVTQLRFANALDGYAFDPELWQTTNGGASWVKVATPGPVAELEAADGEAYALGCDAANCASIELRRSPVGSLKWQKVSTPVPLKDGPSLAVNGTNLYVLGGETGGQRLRPFLLYSDDKAASFVERVDPCTAVLGGRVTAAADGSSSIWAACPTGTEAGTWLSNNGGTNWLQEQGGFPNSVQLAAASSLVALASSLQDQNGTPPDAMERTTNGGRSYSPVLSVSSFSTVLWVGFSDPVRAYALVEEGGSGSTTARLYESNDAGAAWHRVAVRS